MFDESPEPEAWPGSSLRMITLTEEERLVWRRHDAALYPDFDLCGGCTDQCPCKGCNKH